RRGADRRRRVALALPATAALVCIASDSAHGAIGRPHSVRPGAVAPSHSVANGDAVSASNEILASRNLAAARANSFGDGKVSARLWRGGSARRGFRQLGSAGAWRLAGRCADGAGGGRSRPHHPAPAAAHPARLFALRAI